MIIGFSCLPDRGQTSIEYLLMLLVVVILITSAMKQVKKFMIGGDGECTENNKSIICEFDRIYTRANFKFYTIKGI